ncbi:SRPBCC family protein [Halosegnis marinus]|uniref:SRPBCC family protein n=1 Tax=Halosegnis marinus TaxID=3034023 RepID=UPI00360CAAC0
MWELFRDTETWAEWGPSVREVESPDRYVAAGTEGRVRTVAGLWLPFAVRTCADYRWTWNVAKLPATGHRVEARAGGCTAVIEIPLPGAAYAPVCERGLRRLRELAEATD